MLTSISSRASGGPERLANSAKPLLDPDVSAEAVQLLLLNSSNEPLGTWNTADIHLDPLGKSKPLTL